MSCRSSRNRVACVLIILTWVRIYLSAFCRLFDGSGQRWSARVIAGDDREEGKGSPSPPLPSALCASWLPHPQTATAGQGRVLQKPWLIRPG